MKMWQLKFVVTLAALAACVNCKDKSGKKMCLVGLSVSLDFTHHAVKSKKAVKIVIINSKTVFGKWKLGEIKNTIFSYKFIKKINILKSFVSYQIAWNSGVIFLSICPNRSLVFLIF